MKYYNHTGEEVSREMFKFLMKKDYMIHDNCFIEKTKDSRRLVSMENIIFDEEMRIVGYKE